MVFEKVRKSELFQKSTSLLKSYRDDTSGATAIEYSIIAGLISVAIVGAVATIGTSVRDNLFNVIAASFESIVGG